MGNLEAKVTIFGDKMLLKNNPNVLKENGIILADTVNLAEMSNDWTVVAVSEGTYQADGTLRPLPYKVGDRVQVYRTEGEVTLYNKEKVHIVNTNMIICRIDE